MRQARTQQIRTYLEQLLVRGPHGDVRDGDLLNYLRQRRLRPEQVLVDLLAHHQRQELDAGRGDDVVVLAGRHLQNDTIPHDTTRR